MAESTDLRALSDGMLLDRVVAEVGVGQQSLVCLLRLLAEAERRRLPQLRGFSSLFAFCRSLGFSEAESYWRVRAARLGSSFPAVLVALEARTISLTTVVAIAPVVSAENCAELLRRASGRSRIEVDAIVATHRPPGKARRDRIDTWRAPVLQGEKIRTASTNGTAGPRGGAGDGAKAGRPAVGKFETTEGERASAATAVSHPDASSSCVSPRRSPGTQGPCTPPLGPQEVRARGTEGLAHATGIGRHAATGAAGHGAGVHSAAAHDIAGAVHRTASTPDACQAPGTHACPPTPDTGDCASGAVTHRLHVDIDAETQALLREAIALGAPRRGRTNVGSVLKRALGLLVSHQRRQKHAALVRRPASTSGDQAAPTVAPPGRVAPSAVPDQVGRVNDGPALQAGGPAISHVDAPGVPASRYVPRGVRRAVYARDAGRCAFVSRDGHRCAASEALEYDHIVPFARGGSHSSANLRLLCRAHNVLAAEQAFGVAISRICDRRGRARGQRSAR